MKRRDFLATASITSLGFLTLSRCSSNFDANGSTEFQLDLIKDPEGYLDLPDGFTYRIISKSGEKMSDELLVPGRPDGMGSFSGENGSVILIRNHENSPSPTEAGAFGPNNEMLGQIGQDKLYDAGSGTQPGLGGTTTIIYDEEKGEVVSEFLSLAGTYRNCAGGVTPWNSWLTCEEDVTKSNGNTVERDHGFVFDVPAESGELVDPKPLLGLGRFNHEAVAVDPATHAVYMTEDRHDGLIYRFVPQDKNDLHNGGELQVLAIKDKPGLDTRNWESILVELNEDLVVEWITIDEVDSPNDDLRYRGFELGAARFARGEGMWLGENEIIFACTNGGPNKFGQIFKYNIQSNSLQLFIESLDKTILHLCDNLTVSPDGIVFVCEDNPELNRIHFVDASGNLKPFAINRSSSSELAGAVFSPSGKTLFVNIQKNGDTVAITGPWEKLV